MNEKLGISVGIVVIVAILAGFFLGQMTARIEPAVTGGIAGAIVSFVFLYFLSDKNFKQEKRRELLEKRLEKLYSPLYIFTKRLKEEDELAIENDIPRIVELIERYCYLASEELKPFLTLMVSYDLYGQDMMREAPEKAEKMFELIKNEYNKFLDEYFACK